MVTVIATVDARCEVLKFLSDQNAVTSANCGQISKLLDDLCLAVAKEAAARGYENGYNDGRKVAVSEYRTPD